MKLEESLNTCPECGCSPWDGKCSHLDCGACGSLRYGQARSKIIEFYEYLATRSKDEDG